MCVFIGVSIKIIVPVWLALWWVLQDWQPCTVTTIKTFMPTDMPIVLHGIVSGHGVSVEGEEDEDVFR